MGSVSAFSNGCKSEWAKCGYDGPSILRRSFDHRAPSALSQRLLLHGVSETSSKGRLLPPLGKSTTRPKQCNSNLGGRPSRAIGPQRRPLVSLVPVYSGDLNGMSGCIGSGHLSNVRFGSKAVIRPRSDQCPLCANSEHSRWASPIGYSKCEEESGFEALTFH